MLRFRNSTEAGKLLARLMTGVVPESEAVVLALRPRGISVAIEVAAAMRAPAGLLEHSGALPAARAVGQRNSRSDGRRQRIHVRLAVAGHTVILVDDGLEHEARAIAGVNAVRTWADTHVMVAVPLASREAYFAIMRLVDRCFCLGTPRPFHSVGFWYDDMPAGRSAYVSAASSPLSIDLGRRSSPRHVALGA